MATKIVKCDCEHVYQDKKYGRGNRVANKCNIGLGGEKHRCTVCGKEH